jgi:transcriptional regulator with XRE-family HTH domain
MKERIIEFLKAENKTSAQLAEEIGVQPSGISHILSGRNNPSLDFVMKMLEKYHYLSTDWLLFGKGVMYKDLQMQTLFDENSAFDAKNNEKEPVIIARKEENVFSSPESSEKSVSEKVKTPGSAVSNVRKIVWFYDDGTFVEYQPSLSSQSYPSGIIPYQKFP